MLKVAVASVILMMIGCVHYPNIYSNATVCDVFDRTYAYRNQEVIVYGVIDPYWEHPRLLNLDCNNIEIDILLYAISMRNKDGDEELERLPLDAIAILGPPYDDNLFVELRGVISCGEFDVPGACDFDIHEVLRSEIIVGSDMPD